MSGFSFEYFCFTVRKKLRRGTLLCCVSESFCNRKVLGLRRGDRRPGYKSFPLNFFCHIVPKTFVENFLVFHKYRVSKNFMLQRFRGHIRISFEVFLSYTAEKFRS